VTGIKIAGGESARLVK